jgi:hypothetical protein
MKNLKIYFAISMLLLASLPIRLDAASNPVSTPITSEAQKAQTLTNRLEEINKMDKSAMTKSQKKVYRQEVRAIKKELNEMGNGIYLSVGAIIIIILLLILLV